MTFINDRMSMLRLQNNNMPGAQYNNNCNCNCNSGFGNSIWGFNAGGMPPMGGNPFGCGGFGFGNGFGGFGFGSGFGFGGFGFGNGFSFGGFGFGPGMGGFKGVFRAMAISSIVENSLNVAFGLTDSILGWCGIRPAGSDNYSAKRAEQEEAAKKQQQAQKDADLLTKTLKDTDEVDYEISQNTDGTVTVTVTDKTEQKSNRILTGSAQSILNDLGYLNNGEITKDEMTEIKDGFKTKLEEITAEDAENPLEFPKGYDGSYEATVDKNGNITVKFKPANGTEGKEIVVTGKSVDEAISNIKTKFAEVKQQQELKEAKDQVEQGVKTAIDQAKEAGTVALPEGYSISKIVVDDDKTKVTIQIKAPEGTQPAVINVTGDDTEKAIDALHQQCAELHRLEGEKQLENLKNSYELPEGYEVGVQGIENGEVTGKEKIQCTFVLLKEGEEPKYFNSISDLMNGINEVWRNHTEKVSNSEYKELNGTTKTVAERDENKHESGNYYKYTNAKGVIVARETKFSGTRVTNFNTEDGTEVHHRIAKLDDVHGESKETTIRDLFSKGEGEQAVDHSELVNEKGKVLVTYKDGKYYNKLGREISEDKVMKGIQRHNGLKIVTHFETEETKAAKAEVAKVAEQTKADTKVKAEQEAKAAEGIKAAKEAQARKMGAAGNNEKDIITSLKDFVPNYQQLTTEGKFKEREEIIRNVTNQNKFTQMLGQKPGLLRNGHTTLNDGTQIFFTSRQDATTGQYYWDIRNIKPGQQQ